LRSLVINRSQRQRTNTITQTLSKHTMSLYLQVATETADLIEHGEVNPNATHSDFERLLSLDQARKRERTRDEKELERARALAEIDAARRARAALREAMQRERHEALLADIAAAKERTRLEAQREETLQERVAAAVAAAEEEHALALLPATSLGLRPASASAGSDNARRRRQSGGDPFLRFRAEDARVAADRERVARLRARYGDSGCDLLGRFIDAASPWSESAMADSAPGSASATPSAAASLDASAAVLDAPHQPEHEVDQSRRLPTVGHLVMHGYGRAKATSMAEAAVEAVVPVVERFASLAALEQRDLAEWRRQRVFFDRERAANLRIMNAEGQFRSSMSSVGAAPPRPGAVLGHDPADFAPRPEHPIDGFHRSVRASVEAVKAASQPWIVLAARQNASVSGSERAANTSAHMMAGTSSIRG
jgi:hypothetical protein